MPKDNVNICTRQISVVPNSLNKEARTIDAVMSTENPTRIFAFDRGDIVEEILIGSGMRSNGKAPLLDSHDRSTIQNIAGSVSNFREQENGDVIGTMTFTSETDAGRSGFELARENHLTDVSVGYQPKAIKDIEPGQSENVNGRDFTAGTIPLRITQEWELKELSLVPIGADSEAKIREEMSVDNRSQLTEANDMPKENEGATG
jgi:hypothetical protein